MNESIFLLALPFPVDSKRIFTRDGVVLAFDPPTRQLRRACEF